MLTALAAGGLVRSVLARMCLAAVCVATMACDSRRRETEESELIVFAAASLREVFQGVAAIFASEHPDLAIHFNFAGSQELRVQLEQGAKAAVFASADWKQMKALVERGVACDPVVFARNSVVVVVPKSNDAGVLAFADLPKAAHLVVGAPEVPIGAYTEAIFTAAEGHFGKAFGDRVRANIRSRELNVRQVMTKVAMGEADAGLVYRTDALTMPDRVDVIEIPSSLQVEAEYPVAVVRSAPRTDWARAFVTLLLSGAGQQVLGAAGFAPAAEQAMK